MQWRHKSDVPIRGIIPAAHSQQLQMHKGTQACEGLRQSPRRGRCPDNKLSLVLGVLIIVLWPYLGCTFSPADEYATQESSRNSQANHKERLDEMQTILSDLSNAVARQDMNTIKRLIDSRSTFYGSIVKNVQSMMDRYTNINLSFTIIDVKSYNGTGRAVVVARQTFEAVDTQTDSPISRRSGVIFEFVQVDADVWKICFWEEDTAMKNIGDQSASYTRVKG